MNLVFFKPSTINDGNSNGGAISLMPVYDSIKNNLFPDIRQDEVLTGLIRVRKFFSIPGSELPYCKAFLDRPTDGQDGVLIGRGTATDTWVDAQSYFNWKGSGLLHTPLVAGAVSTIVVTSENEGEGFNPLDVIRISDGVDQEFIRINDVSWSGREATLTCVSGSVLANGYAAGSYVSACIEKGVSNTFALWLREIVPADCVYCYNNASRIRFLL